MLSPRLSHIWGLIFFFLTLFCLSGLVLIFFTPVGEFVVDVSVPLGYHNVSRVNENNLRCIFWD